MTSCYFLKPIVAVAALSAFAASTSFSGNSFAQDDDSSDQGVEVSSQGKSSKKGPGDSHKYMQLNLLRWKQTNAETVTKTNRIEKAPSKNTALAFDQSDTLEFGVFGKSMFILAGVENPTDYSLAIGWRNPTIEAGLELGYATSETESTTFTNGSEIKTVSESNSSLYGIIFAFVMGEKNYTAKVKFRGGLTYSDSSTDNSIVKAKTSDFSGNYFGLGLEYARKVSSLGPNVSFVHGLDYLYTKNTNKNPVDGNNRDAGESTSKSHVWSLNLLGLRLHF